MHRIISLNQDRGIRPDSAKGAAVHLQSMREAFRKLGVDVIAVDSSDEAHVGKRLHQLHAERSIDLIYERYAVGKAMGARCAAELNIPLVVEVNSPLAYERETWRGGKDTPDDICYDAILFHIASAAVAVSKPVAEYAVQRGLAPDRVQVYANGIDRDRFNILARRNSIRSELGLDDKFVIGFHGRERPWHSFHLLIKVVENLLANNLPVHFLVIGDGDFGELGNIFSEHVTHVGWQEHTRIPQYVAAFDVLPMAYSQNIPYYFSPLKLMEAMACGVVPVVPPLGELSDTVHHLNNGLVLTEDELTNQVESLTKSLQWLIDNPRRKKTMSANAAKFARQFTWERIAEFVLKFANTEQQDQAIAEAQ